MRYCEHREQDFDCDIEEYIAGGRRGSMRDDRIIEGIYQEKLEERIIEYLADKRGLSFESANGYIL